MRNNNLVKINGEMLKVAYIFAGLFMALIIYFIHFSIVKAPIVINNSYNKLQDLLEKNVVRGRIISNDGTVLAYTTDNGDGTYTRNYPYKNAFAHIVGFSTNGRSGLELTANVNLLTSHDIITTRAYNKFIGNKNIGDNIITTLDKDLQVAAYHALGNKKGAVIVMEANTGKILSMVSKPDFDPNTISSNWESITQEDSEGKSVLLNRATQGLYAPGSTFKILTSLEYIRKNTQWKDYHYYCNSKNIFNSVVIRCAGNKSHGDVDLYKAFAESCNGAFANIGINFNQDEFHHLCVDMLYNQELPYDMVYNQSRYGIIGKSDKGLIPQTVIGQGDTLITPLHNLLIVSAVANGGTLMRPYLVDRVENCNGGIVSKNTPKAYKQIITNEEAQILSQLMEGVVKNGTAAILKNNKYKVAGKTGTVQHGKNTRDHSWFVGFAEKGNRNIVISVIVEEASGTGMTGTSVAKKILDQYYKK